MVEINNLTGIKIKEDFIKKILDKILEQEKKQGNISVSFIGPERMQKLNKRYRKKNRVTDILSFSESKVLFEKFFIRGIEKTKSLGEIVICLREIKKNARRLNVAFDQELTKALIHGALHILGYDHEKGKEQAEEMEDKEIKYLEKLMN